MPTIESTFGSVKGYRRWYSLIANASNLEAFVVDFETYIFQEEEEIDGRLVKREVTGIMIYFLTRNGETLKKCRAFLERRPYFYLLPKEGVDAGLLASRVRNLEENCILDVSIEQKYDMAELTFPSLKSFVKVVVRTPLDVPKIRDRLEQLNVVQEWREADVQFHHRCAIDAGIRVGKWYHFTIRRGRILDVEESERKEVPELRVLCYDIEVDMEPTRDPNPDKDPISLIAVYTDDENYVLINKEAVTDVSEVTNFYVILRQPDAEHSLPWVDWIPENQLTEELEKAIVQKVFTRTIIFEKEAQMLEWFFTFIDQYQPDIFADFYGDRFDIPFLIHRSRKFGIDWLSKSGFKIELKMEARDKDLDSINWLRDVDYVASVGMFHVDAFLWTQKYSYLPKKDIALKNAVKKRLKIIPIGREALWAMRESPLEGIAYAGSDGYITYRFVKELVLDFCIAMGQMFPVPTAEILTKRAGSLDDLLIDSIAYQRNIVAIKRYQQTGIGAFTKNLVIKNVAYTGGLVEARNPGIWRKDLEYSIRINPKKLDRLIQVIPEVIQKQARAFLDDAKNEYFEQQVSEFILEDYQLERAIDDEFMRLTNLIKETFQGEEQVEKMKALERIYHDAEALIVVNLEREILDKVNTIKRLKDLFKDETERKLHLQGMHADVTSMYPSQIRQYKIQPSGIVHPSFCDTCQFKEPDNSCMLDGLWTLKITLGKPCQYKQKSGEYCEKYRKPCPFNAEEEDGCEGYDAGVLGERKAQEIFAYDPLTRTERAYIIEDNRLREVPIPKTFFGSGLGSRVSPWSLMHEWVEKHVPGTILSPTLNETDLEVAEVGLPKGAFMFIDVRSKNITALVSVKSRVCQKAYDFVSAIMNDFFQKRVYHKKEAKRLKKYIKTLKKSGKPVPEKVLALQKFHDATQLGLKVPLNSIYGLLGMKGGVRNASAPSAGITTAFSAKLIKWTADYLEDFAIITELDTDGIWMFLPTDFPLFYTLQVGLPAPRTASQEHATTTGGESSHQAPETVTIIKTAEFGLLEQILNHEVDLTRRNDNYWVNDLHSPLRRETRSLLRFEQDGPYDMMLVMGKKKYVVYNRSAEGVWKEEELTGLETKRQDFSMLVKAFQEELIKGYLDLWQQTSSLADVYENVVLKSLQFYQRMVSGSLDIEYYVKPKSINKPPEEYKSLQPHVACAYILKELGYSIEPGMRIDMLQIKSGSGKKSDAAIPVQLFEFDFKVIKRVLTRRGISTLAFMMGNIHDKKTLLREILDMDEYVSNLFDPGRLFDRMVIRLMIAQNVSITLPKDLPNASFYEKMLPKTINRLERRRAATREPETPMHSTGELGHQRSSLVATRSRFLARPSIQVSRVTQSTSTSADNMKTDTGDVTSEPASMSLRSRHRTPKSSLRAALGKSRKSLDDEHRQGVRITKKDAKIKHSSTDTKGMKSSPSSSSSPTSSSTSPRKGDLTKFFAPSEDIMTTERLLPKSTGSSKLATDEHDSPRAKHIEAMTSESAGEVRGDPSSLPNVHFSGDHAHSLIMPELSDSASDENVKVERENNPVESLSAFIEVMHSKPPTNEKVNKESKVNLDDNRTLGKKITDLRAFFSITE